MSECNLIENLPNIDCGSFKKSVKEKTEKRKLEKQSRTRKFNGDSSSNDPFQKAWLRAYLKGNQVFNYGYKYIDGVRYRCEYSTETGFLLN